MIDLPAPNSTAVGVPPRLLAKAVDAAVKAVREDPPSICTPDAVIDPVGAVAPPTPISPPAVPVTVLGVALVIAALASTP